jgi:hypothetical protein
LTHEKEPVTFTIFIPIRHMDAERSFLYLYYCGLESSGNQSRLAFQRQHWANGDLQVRLTVSTEPEEGSAPAKYVWRLDEQMADAFWVHDVLMELVRTHRAELKEFLAQCHRDAMVDPARPFRAVFSSIAQSDGF